MVQFAAKFILLKYQIVEDHRDVIRVQFLFDKPIFYRYT